MVDRTHVLDLPRSQLYFVAFAAVLWTGVCQGEERQPKTHNVILVTIDGLRWQEAFTGADESLIDKEFGGVKETGPVRDEFCRPTPEERREVLMPFFWRVIAAQGRVFGNPEDHSVALVRNEHCFSYPGYHEILVGRPDPRIDSNAKRPNPNVTVLEWLHRHDPYAGRIQAFASWDVFPFIINAERSGIPVNAGWTPLSATIDDPSLRQLDELSAELPHYWHNVRYDYFTFRGALTSLRQQQPRVLYVAFGETDDWAHARRYDLYLDAARRTDSYLEQLWAEAQRLPQYAGTTSLIVTTDHGRGDTRVDWTDHGKDVSGSERIWIAVLGPDAPHGPPPRGHTVTQGQVAATVASLLGLDFQDTHPETAPPLPVGSCDSP